MDENDQKDMIDNECDPKKSPQWSQRNVWIEESKLIGLDSETYSIDRCKRNKEHAKRSRLRQKFLLESIQSHERDLQSEIDTLRNIIRKECPGKANQLLEGIAKKSLRNYTWNRNKTTWRNQIIVFCRHYFSRSKPL